MAENLKIEISHYSKLLDRLLPLAECLYGKKIQYEFNGIFYKDAGPQTIESEKYSSEAEPEFEVHLKKNAEECEKSGIFQISHETIHLLAPITYEKSVNYLEEGLAVHFSKFITEIATRDYDFTNNALNHEPKYKEAYQRYLQLHNIDQNSIIKLRQISPIMADIKPIHFKLAGIKIEDNLINKLLESF